MGLDQTARMKTENRNPKAERSPKPEIRNQIRAGRSHALNNPLQKAIQNFVPRGTKFCMHRLIVPMYVKMRMEAFRDPFTKTGQLQSFGIRPLDFFRISA
jgi:hypothetical protein